MEQIFYIVILINVINVTVHKELYLLKMQATMRILRAFVCDEKYRTENFPVNRNKNYYDEVNTDKPLLRLTILLINACKIK